MARAALGLLRVCQRLLPYKEGTADVLLKSLQLLLRLSPAAAWDLAQPIAAEVCKQSVSSVSQPNRPCSPLHGIHRASGVSVGRADVS